MGAKGIQDGFMPLKQALDPQERDYLRRVLEWTRGNRTQAADILGINRSTLFNKMRKHDLLNVDFGRTA
jgi:DNA-binding protein Fis